MIIILDKQVLLTEGLLTSAFLNGSYPCCHKCNIIMACRGMKKVKSADLTFFIFASYTFFYLYQSTWGGGGGGGGGVLGELNPPDLKLMLLWVQAV